MKQSCWETVSKHHVVVNDVAECWEHGPIINPEQTVTLHTNMERLYQRIIPWYCI